MEGGGRISGNLVDIQQAIRVMSSTGQAATDSATNTANVSDKMHAQISEATTMLTNYFNGMAEALRNEIKKTKNQLGIAQWEGNAKANAEAAETALNLHVDTVLHNAAREVGEFQASMLGRALGFLTGIQTQFATVMGQIDTSYQDLAKASQTFADNLQAADESIKFGGGSPL